MANYIFTNKAVEDLSKIWDYTYETWSEEQADKYYCQLLDYCQSLANNQSLGKKYEKLATNYWDIELTSILFFIKP